MRYIITTLVVMILILAIGLVIFFSCTDPGRRIWNEWHYGLQKADDATQYATRKHVEDSCRAMMASYESDRLTWEQYKDADGEQRGWADLAKMRANKTAASYNEYVLKNSFVWQGNIPDDVAQRLEYIQ